MATKTRKAKRTVATKSRKTKKVIVVKSLKARKPAAKKPARKAARRSSSDTAKLQKAVIKALKSGKSAATVAAEHGISKPYIYVLKNKG